MGKKTYRRVLVTAIGTVNGGAAVDELRNWNEKCYIIGANSTPPYYTATSKFVDEYYQFPSAIEDKEGYLRFVLDFCAGHGITHIICFIDEEVEALVRSSGLFLERNIRLCLADYSTVSICHFKDRFSKWIKEQMPEIWIKEYADYTAIPEDEFPVFAKPIEGRASIGCRIIEGAGQLSAFLSETNHGGQYILQEFADGVIVGADIVRNRKHRQVKVIQKKELMRNAKGCGTVVEIIDDERIEKICCALADKLDLNGVINAEFFVSEYGIRIIEVNPRLPAGTSYSCLAGGNTVRNSVLIAEGKPCVFDDIKVGAVYARRYETYEM